MFQITRNTLVDYYRTAVRRKEIPSGLLAEAESQEKESVRQPDSYADPLRHRRELATCLGPMIAQLPDLYREAMRLTELKGLTEREAAKHLVLSVSGVKSRVQRGRRKLREMLEACCRIELDRRKGIVSYEVRDPNCRSCEPDGPN
jgi:RNA polymerase sigma-70 factor (ECF subfamily)